MHLLQNLPRLNEIRYVALIYLILYISTVAEITHDLFIQVCIWMLFDNLLRAQNFLMIRKFSNFVAQFVILAQCLSIVMFSAIITQWFMNLTRFVVVRCLSFYVPIGTGIADSFLSDCLVRAKKYQQLFFFVYQKIKISNLNTDTLNFPLIYKKNEERLGKCNFKL